MARLGGSSFVITPGAGHLAARDARLGAVMDGAAAEHVREGIPVLASYCDALGIRAFADGKDLAADLAETRFNAMAQLVDKPLINLESAINHPCQALADWKTMDDLGVPRKRPLRALLGLPSARAAARRAGGRAAHGGACAAWRSSCCGPEGFALPPRDHGEGAARRGALGRLRARDQRSRGGARRARTSSMPRNGARPACYGDAAADARLRARAQALVRAQRLVRARRRATAA